MSTVMPHPQRFSGDSVVSWSDLDITISVPWYLGLMFRTRKEDGVLMEATAGVSSRLHLQVSGSPVPPRAPAGQLCTRVRQPEARAVCPEAGPSHCPRGAHGHFSLPTPLVVLPVKDQENVTTQRPAPDQSACQPCLGGGWRLGAQGEPLLFSHLPPPPPASAPSRPLPRPCSGLSPAQACSGPTEGAVCAFRVITATIVFPSLTRNCISLPGGPRCQLWPGTRQAVFCPGMGFPSVVVLLLEQIKLADSGDEWALAGCHWQWGLHRKKVRFQWNNTQSHKLLYCLSN